jgi:hypothetical protein
MTTGTPNFFDTFSADEAELMAAIMAECSGEAWAQPLITAVNENGGLTGENKARFFELRFGYSLRNAGITPRYEIPGEGDSTLDFGFTSGDQPWAVELMRLEETQAARRATHSRVDEDGVPWTERILSTNADDRRRSTEGETIKAVERICQKCERGGQPHKFPAPHGVLHVILVDFRTYLHGGDAYDRVHIGLGGEFVPEQMARLYWEGRLISGVFSPRTQSKGAQYARERVHFIGFVHERAYTVGEFGTMTKFIANPILFADAAAVQAAIATWPLQPVLVLNGGK